MRSIISIAFVIISQVVFGQHSFIKMIDESPDYGGALDAIETLEGGYMVCGQIPESPSILTAPNALIARTDERGEIYWIQSLGTTGFTDYAEDIILEEDGSFTFCGINASYGPSNQYNWIYHMSPTGDSLWSYNFYGGELSSIIKTSDGNYVAGGEVNIDGSQKFYVLKINSEGDSLWSRSYGGYGSFDHCESLIETSDGNILAAGHITDEISGAMDFFIVKLSQSGEEIWTSQFETATGDFGQSVIELTDGNYIFGGSRSYYPDPVGSDVMIMKIDDEGNALWTQVIGDDLASECYQVAPSADGGFVSVGSNRIPGVSGSFVYLLKFDAAGDTLWSRNIREETDLQGIGISVEQTSDKGYVIAAFLGPSFATQGSALIKTDSLGEITSNTTTVSAYYDENENLIRDPDEIGVPGEVVEGQPFNLLGLTNSEGMTEMIFYHLDTFMTKVSHPDYWYQTFPDTSEYHYLYIDSFDQELDTLWFAKDLIPGIIDVSVDFMGSPAQPGFNVAYNIHYQNEGTEVIPAGEITYFYNEELNFVSSSFPPDEVSDTSLSWSYSDLELFSGSDIELIMQLEPSASPGSYLNHELRITPLEDDYNPLDNIHIWHQVITASFDPNDKLSQPEGDGFNRIPVETDSVTYTIRFQNTGTAAASFILITDTIDTDLDLSTFDLISYSHDLTVDIESPGVLKFLFNPIFLPDSTTDEVNSHGFVKFRIDLKDGLEEGSIIENSANIFFDFNSPVITNTVELILSDEVTAIQDQTPIQKHLKLHPNPVSDKLVLSGIEAEAVIEEISIFNTEGRLVKKLMNRSDIDDGIDVSGLIPGVYLIELQFGENGEYYTGKFVKVDGGQE